MNSIRDDLIARIIAERNRQFNLPGLEFDIMKTPSDWCTLIGHYVFSNANRGATKPNREEFEEDLIRAAAVLLATLEHVDHMAAKKHFSAITSKQTE